MKNDLIVLRKVTRTKDADGYDVKKTVSERNVFTERKSVTHTEFYEAMQIGIHADVIFILNAEEYDGETEIRFAGTTYAVVRTYQTDIGNIELTCSEGEGV